MSAFALATACALAATAAGPASAALAAAECTEYVGIGSFYAEGVDLHAAEVVSLNVLSDDNGDRGGGTAHAWIDPVDPVSEYSPAIVVPEPAVWLLLLAGLPCCLRRRRGGRAV